MKIEKQIVENHQAQLTVEFDETVMTEYSKRAARKLAQQIKIPGFRPGKAPYQVIQRYVGEQHIAEEAVDLIVDDLYPEVLKEAEIEPSAPGQLQSVKSIIPLVLEFIVPLKAEIDLGTYQDIRLPYEETSISEDEVDNVIRRLQDAQAIIEPVDRPVQAGDVVSIKLAGIQVGTDGSENTTIIEERAQTINVLMEESDEASEWPFPGFSKALINLQASDEIDVEQTYPSDYQFAALRDKKVIYKVKVEEVKSKTLPEINDDLAAAAGEFSTLYELRAAVRKDLEARARDEYHVKYNDQIMDVVIEQSIFRYPSQLLDREIDEVIHRLEHRLSEQNLDLDLYLKTREMDKAALREESRPVAEKRLKKSLAIMEIAEKEAIKVEPEELQSETLRTLNQYSQLLPEKDMRRLMTKEGTDNLVGNIMMDMLVNKTMARLRDFARGITPEVSTESHTPEELAADGEAVTEPVVEIQDIPANTTG